MRDLPYDWKQTWEECPAEDRFELIRKVEQFQRRKVMRRYWKWIAISLVGLCMLGYIISLFSPPLSNDDQLATALSNLQTENAPTSTTVSVETAIPSTTPQFSEDEKAYVLFTGTEFQAFADAFNDFMELNDQASQNSSLIIDPVWREDLMRAFDKLQLHSQNFAAYSPVPPRFSLLNDALDNIYAETLLMTNNYSRGVETLDNSLIDAAVENVENMGGYMRDVNAELDKFINQ